ncbi:hypothetical protein CU669_02610 [Paramagnetospirillum kuznetsovii]|uniref:Uncharacterized protein n=1 Tax=Paramagnetospirillum kuznetsovii TaxID=2053833 RepID=A0A364P492_9PROT|nr:hypothetical protein [Paramagnetospirillum kuznetsovii]RAU23977.1 hypothetical protein CU669_02610 [Paramagnetospirillum kuznetsovii]
MALNEVDENEMTLLWRLAEHLNREIQECLTRLNIDAQVSMFRLVDIIHRWKRDINKMERDHPHGVHAIKHIAYQAFWIRKLKPTSNAYRIKDLEEAEARDSQVSPAKEIVDINERLSILVAIRYMMRFAEKGLYPSTDAEIAEGSTAIDPDLLQDYLREYMYFPHRKSAMPGSTYDNLIHNQRYRTFGPHHLAHIFDQVTYGAMRLQAERRKTANKGGG